MEYAATCQQFELKLHDNKKQKPFTFMYVEPVSDAVSSSVVIVPAVLPQRCASTCVYLATYHVRNTQLVIERVQACTRRNSLTFRVRVTTPRSMDEMERRTQQARRFYRRRGSLRRHA